MDSWVRFSGAKVQSWVRSFVFYHEPPLSVFSPSSRRPASRPRGSCVPWALLLGSFCRGSGSISGSFFRLFHALVPVVLGPPSDCSSCPLPLFFCQGARPWRRQASVYYSAASRPLTGPRGFESRPPSSSVSGHRRGHWRAPAAFPATGLQGEPRPILFANLDAARSRVRRFCPLRPVVGAAEERVRQEAGT